MKVPGRRIVILNLTWEETDVRPHRHKNEYFRLTETPDATRVEYLLLHTGPDVGCKDAKFLGATTTLPKSEFTRMWKAFNSVGLDFHNEYVLRIVPSADNPSDLLCLTSDDINSCARVYGTQEYWRGKWPVPPPLKPLLNLWYHEAEELRKVVPARPLTDNEIHAIADNCARDWPLNVRWRAYEAANRISGSTANCPEMRSGKVPKY